MLAWRPPLIRITAIILSLVLTITALWFILFRTSTSEDLPQPSSASLYRNDQVSVETRVADLLSYMTLEEKVGQMALVEKNSIDSIDDVSTYGIGAILSGFGGKPEDNTPSGWREMVDSFVSESHSSRLGIPILYGVDAIHGHSNVPGATVFPHFIGLGASGDPLLVEKIARATGEELLATGVRWSYSPTYDLPEDIRWGRVYEAFTDDPVLAGRLGSAYIKGLQNQSTSPSSTISVLATPKHYLGAGGMLWNSSSNKEFRIDQGYTPISEGRLRTHYLPPFKEAVDAGAISVMAGLNSWGETKIAASSYLLQTVLKDEIGFKGFVVSDWYGVYEIPGSDYQAGVTAINAGVDMVMLPFDYVDFVKNVTRAVRVGAISEERINDAVRRILSAKFRLGLFDTENDHTNTIVGNKEHRALARQAVAQSLVLLKNNHSVLPLTRTTKTIRIAGSAADNIGRQTGAWTVEWQGIDGNWLPGATSILQGIRDNAPAGTTIEYDRSGNFSTTTKADIGIAIVGESPYAEGWGDNEYPSLSPDDLAAIEKLRSSSDIVVVVLITGRPLIITDHLPSWDAAVVAWLPGSEGAGISDVLFGKKPFTGKLPLPWPASVAQLPVVDNKTSDGTPLLFPRYFGLRY